MGWRLTTMRTYVLPTPFLLLALAAPALAVDGVLEINQTCAVQTGCFVGDTAGYPVTIYSKTGGSYRLTGDLLGVAGSHGIVEARDRRVPGGPGT